MKDSHKRRKDRLLNHLAKIGSSDDLEAYLEHTEHHLQHCEVEQEEWQFYLTSNLTGRHLELVQGLTVADDDGCATVKARLLEAAGYTRRDAGIRCFESSQKDFAGKTAMEFFQTGTRLTNRMTQGEDSIIDCKLAFTLSWARKNLPEKGREFLDNRKIATGDELLEALQTWWSISGGIKDEAQSASKPKFQSYSFKPPSAGCFNCGKIGHRAADCKLNQSRPGEHTVNPPAATKDQEQQWTCYTCGKKGHKSPQCPLREVSGKKVPVPPKVKTEKTTYKVSTPEPQQGPDNTVCATLNGEKRTFVLDSCRAPHPTH